ncbi:hypothetical protein PAPYR_8309 [Paratrimastix pyriformis]|uniref:DNA mismatch repair protein MutS clamp domain-containing protein n=1 Tax=Paratrimastix pyriformis TaxID=342808 RepID=A0ABQ8UF42_9EUKA|nr:hypothetical protein PAPYR_8309 [Paratrimastix pyriformis]
MAGLLAEFKNGLPPGAGAKQDKEGRVARVRTGPSDFVITPPAGQDPDYDRAHETARQIEGELDGFLARVRKQLGEPRIKFKTVGTEAYQMEIPVAWVQRNEAKLPPEFSLQSTTKEVKRYWAPEIRDLLPRLGEAQEAMDAACRTYYKVRVYYPDQLDYVRIPME